MKNPSEGKPTDGFFCVYLAKIKNTLEIIVIENMD